jgi:hypothetical protein
MTEYPRVEEEVFDCSELAVEAEVQNLKEKTM